MPINLSLWGPVNIKIRSCKKILLQQLKTPLVINSTCITPLESPTEIKQTSNINNMKRAFSSSL